MTNDFPPVPTNRHELINESLRHTDRVSGLLNEVDAELDRLLGNEVDDPKWEPLHTLLRRRFSDCSGVYLFIGARNLHNQGRLELDDDLLADDIDHEND